MDKVYCIIQSRSNNTRLPGKAYLPFPDGGMILWKIALAVDEAKLVNDYCIAVPFGDTEAIKQAIPVADVFTGSETDVLDRFYQCAKLIKPDHIVRITADCPLLTANIIDTVVKAHLESGAEYTANRLKEPMYPDGFDVEVFTFDTLEQAWLAAPHIALEEYSAYNREHVTPWIKEYNTIHTVHCPPELLPWKDVKLSVDTQEDYERVLKWYEENKHVITER